MKEGKGIRRIITKTTDSLLVQLLHHAQELDLPEDRETCFSFILCGQVGVVRDPLRKEAEEFLRDHRQRIPKGSCISLYPHKKKYVSRGGRKLEAVLHAWQVPVSGSVWIDCGASTGGFTNCLLQHGAEHVYAVDVGYNQLDYSLQVHERVDSFERTNIMDLGPADFLSKVPNAAVIDVSFRSLCGILSHLLSLVSDRYIVALCKPQFELSAGWSRDNLHIPQEGFAGVVSEQYLKELLMHTLQKLSEEKVYVHRILRSSIRGSKGNQEFFFEVLDKPPKTEMKSLASYYESLVTRSCKQTDK